MTIGLTLNLTLPKLAQFWTARLTSRWLACFFLLLVGALLLPCLAMGEEQLTEGSSNKKFRKQTVQSLPLQQLNAEMRDKISNVVDKPSIYRRLPVTSIQADPDHFRFLVRYPDVIVNIWQLMGVTKMETERTGPYSIKTNDGAGTISSLELVYGTEKFHIFYGTGTYEGPVLKRKLSGECVLVLQTDNQMGRDGKPVQTSQLDVFLKVKNATAGLIAKTIQPLVGTTADHNFVESLKFVQRLNETTSKNGHGVAQMSDKLKIDNQVRQKYKKVVDLVFQRAISRAGAAKRNPTTRSTQNTNPNASRVNPVRTTSGPTTAPNLNSYRGSQSRAFPGNATTNSQRNLLSSGQLPARTPLPARGAMAPEYPAPGVSRAIGYQSNGTNVLQTGAQQLQHGGPLQPSAYRALQIPHYESQLKNESASPYRPPYANVPSPQPAAQPRYTNQNYPGHGQQYAQPPQGWHGK